MPAPVAAIASAACAFPLTGDRCALRTRATSSPACSFAQFGDGVLGENTKSKCLLPDSLLRKPSQTEVVAFISISFGQFTLFLNLALGSLGATTQAQQERCAWDFLRHFLGLRT